MTDLANANLPSSSPITMTRKMQGMEKASNRNLAERRCSRDRLCLRIDRAKSDARVFCPIGNQAPSHEHNLSLSSISVQSDDRLESLRCYVPRRPEVKQRWTLDSEMFNDFLFVGASSVSATHGKILFRN